MNDRQNKVVATVAAGLLLCLFVCPWRVASSDEIRWSPIYQPPMTFVRSYDSERFGEEGGARIEGEDAIIAVDILALQVLVVGAVGGGMYVLSGNSDASA